jgi:bifunctional non-homologous end joining protein LigD
VVEVDGRTVRLTNPDKVLYPATGFTKGQVVDYYLRVAPVLLAHLAGRCITLRRFPDGVEADSFFEKRCPTSRPDWVHTAPGPGWRNGPVEYCLLEERAALAWSANLAALELHAPLARATAPQEPDVVVFDLDPGPPAGLTECAVVARWLRTVLDGIGLTAYPKTSGSKGLQVYVPLDAGHSFDHTRSFALAVGQVLEREHPRAVLTRMDRAERTGKVFVDWSQNAGHKTTVSVYSLRGRARPTVSTPVTWDEVDAAAQGASLLFEAPAVLERVARLGDLFAPVLRNPQRLPAPR